MRVTIWAFFTWVNDREVFVIGALLQEALRQHSNRLCRSHRADVEYRNLVRMWTRTEPAKRNPDELPRTTDHALLPCSGPYPRSLPSALILIHVARAVATFHLKSVCIRKRPGEVSVGLDLATLFLAMPAREDALTFRSSVVAHGWTAVFGWDLDLPLPIIVGRGGRGGGEQ